MNKKTIITALLTLVAMAGQAQKEVIWENPSAFTGTNNISFTITKMEMSETETVMHFRVRFTPHYWIRFVKESFLRTPDGKEYPVVSGTKTCEAESDLLLDSLFWMPDDGQANLVLHFKPVPTDTKEMDFIEGYDEGAFRFFNICDAKAKTKPEWPAEWKNVQYDKDETLPEAKIGKGVARIKVKILDYKPDMKLNLFVTNFRPLGSKEYLDKVFPISDDGTVIAEIPLWLTRTAYVGIAGLTSDKIIIAPGQEISLLMDITSYPHHMLAMQGFLAKTNMDIAKEYERQPKEKTDYELCKALSQCNTPEERLSCLKNEFENRIAYAKASDYTTAAKDLLCMEAEGDFVEYTRFFGGSYTNLLMMTGNAKITSQKDYSDLLQANDSLLVLPESDKAYTYHYLGVPASPCSEKFWSLPLHYFDKDINTKNPWLDELQTVYFLFNNDERDWDEQVDSAIKSFKYEDCKNVIIEYQKEQQKMAETLASDESVFFKKYDDVAPEKILQTILDKYKGKTVLIDIWATWCGPCRAGHRAMAPMKERMKGQNIQFVYITSPSSPLTTWQEMIKDIDGDHYYLTNEQYRYILEEYESEGIPTYAIYNPQGEQTYKTIGFPGIDAIRKELESANK